MAKINNTSLYSLKQAIELQDFLLATDKATGKTISYELSTLLQHIIGDASNDKLLTDIPMRIEDNVLIVGQVDEEYFWLINGKVYRYKGEYSISISSENNTYNVYATESSNRPFVLEIKENSIENIKRDRIFLASFVVSDNQIRIENLEVELTTEKNKITVLEADNTSNKTEISTTKTNVGDLSKLTTTAKSNLVGSINELNNIIGSLGGGFIPESITPTSSAPTVTNGYWAITQAGTYTNFGNVVLPENNFGFIFKNGNNFSIQSVEMTTKGVDILNPTGVEIPNEKAVAEYVDLLFFNENINLGSLSTDVITSTGYSTSHPSFNCTPFINVSLNEEITYFGKVTLVDTNASTNAYSVAGYDKHNYFVEFLLGNTINEKGTFRVSNASIVKIKACSRVGYPLMLIKKVSKIGNQLINSKSVLNPLGVEIPNEKAVAEYVDSEFLEKIQDEFYIEKIDLSPLSEANIGSSGYAQTNTGFDCSDYKSVSVGDEYDYIGKVTSVNGNTAGSAYAVAGYNNENYFVEFLLGNDINDKGSFTIKNPEITKIKASSRKGYGLSLRKKSDKILSEKIEGIDVINLRLITLENSSGIGKYKTNLSWASIGDSITYAGGYQAKVMDKLDFTSYQNRGYAGKGFVDDAERGSILSNIQNITSFNLYTLFGGTNDFRLDKPLGVWEDYLNDTGSITFYGALRKTIDLLYTKNSSCKIIVFTPLRRNNADYTSFSTNLAGHKLNDYREALIKIAEHEALTILDLFMDSGITDRNLSIYTSDGLHPRATGHALIAHRLITEIKRITA